MAHKTIKDPYSEVFKVNGKGYKWILFGNVKGYKMARSLVNFKTREEARKDAEKMLDIFRYYASDPYQKYGVIDRGY